MLSLDYASFIVMCIYEHAILCLFSFISLLFLCFLYLFLFRTESRRFYLCKNKTFAWRCSDSFNLFRCSIFVVAFFLEGFSGDILCVTFALFCIDFTSQSWAVVDSLSSWSSLQQLLFLERIVHTQMEMPWGQSIINSFIFCIIPCAGWSSAFIRFNNFYWIPILHLLCLARAIPYYLFYAHECVTPSVPRRNTTQTPQWWKHKWMPVNCIRYSEMQFWWRTFDLCLRISMHI